MALYSHSRSSSNSSASPLCRRPSSDNAPSPWQSRTSFKGAGRQPSEKAPLAGDLTARAQPSAPRGPGRPLSTGRTSLDDSQAQPLDAGIRAHRPPGSETAASRGGLRVQPPPLPAAHPRAPSPGRAGGSQPARAPAAADEPHSRRDAAPPPKPALGKDGRPISYVCYLCGAQFGSRSLRIHLVKCGEKWQAKEETKPRKERRPLPPPPPALDADNLPTSADAIEVFNADMFAYYNKVSLCQCRHCGRSFNEEAFARHAAMCTAERPGGALAKGGGAQGAFGGGASHSAGAAGSGWPAQKPRAYVCYLCGQQYGSQSLKIHIPSCQDKFIQVQLQKPKAERRKLPPPPPQLDAPLPSDAAGIDAFNSAMFGYYNGVSLYQCQNCGRSFNADAFERHKKLCTADRPAAGPAARALGADSAPARLGAARTGEPRAEPPRGLGDDATPLPDDAAEGGGASLLPCSHCGRTFNEEAVARHGKVCTAARPFKPIATRAAQPKPMPPRQAAAGLAATPSKPRSEQTATSPTAAAVRTASPHPPAEGADEANACRVCGRMFARSALARHEAVCESAFGKATTPAPPAAVTATSARVAASGATAQPAACSPQTAGGGLSGVPGNAARVAAEQGLGDDQDDASPLSGRDAPEGDERVDTAQCQLCGRSFNAQALARHEVICAKVFQTKRKPMDMSAQRLAGVVPSGKRPGAAAKPAARQACAAESAPKWKTQSAEMRAAMRASREVSRRLANGESLADIPYVPSAPDPSLVQCPHCCRRYNEQAAARHIPLCANIINKPKFLKAGTGGAGKGAPTTLRRVPGR